MFNFNSEFKNFVIRSLTNIEGKIDKTMASIANILAAQGQEKADLATLVGLVNSLLVAIANETITPAQAQAILTEMQSEDSSITTLSASVNAVVPPTPAPVVTSSVKGV
jgi:hypothetical protein